MELIIPWAVIKNFKELELFIYNSMEMSYKIVINLILKGLSKHTFQILMLMNISFAQFNCIIMQLYIHNITFFLFNMKLSCLLWILKKFSANYMIKQVLYIIHYWTERKTMGCFNSIRFIYVAVWEPTSKNQPKV